MTIAESARKQGGGFVTFGETGSDRETRLGSIRDLVADEVQKHTGKESPCGVFAHLQRDGSPTTWDRQLCTRFGVSAVELIAEEKYGQPVALTHQGIAPVELQGAIDQICTAPPRR